MEEYLYYSKWTYTNKDMYFIHVLILFIKLITSIFSH